MNTRTARGLLALAILTPIVLVGALLMACGAEWFPSCKDPQHPCPPMPEPQPVPFGTPHIWVGDAGHDFVIGHPDASIDLVTIEQDPVCDGGVHAADNSCVRVGRGRIRFEDGGR